MTGSNLHHDPPGFTPARRPQQLPLQDTPAAINDIAWTTARCNRLLRPISSRIALLRKPKPIHKRAETVHLGQSEAIAKSHRPTPELESKQEEDDLEWVPSERPKKMIRRKYSARNVASQTSSQTRQPVVVRALDMLTRPEDSASCEKGPEALEAENPKLLPPIKKRQKPDEMMGLRHLLRQVAKTEAPADWMLYDGLNTSLSNLLDQTARKQSRPSTGARSLASMCLCKIPDLIRDEQAIEDEKLGDAAEDVTSSIYGDLETYGTHSSAGWKPFRELVRAHGVGLISEVIEHGLVKPLIARGFILVCLRVSAYSEAQLLCSALLSRVKPIKKPSETKYPLFEDTTSIALKVLYELTHKTEQWDYMFRSLTDLLKRGILPVEWMGRSDLTRCWSKVFKTDALQISKDAVELIRVTIRLGYQSPGVDMADFVHDFRLSSNLVNMTRRSGSKAIENHLQKWQPNKGDLQSMAADADKVTTISNLMGVLLASTCHREKDPQPEVWIEILGEIFLDFTCQQEFVSKFPCLTIASTNMEIPAILSFAATLVPGLAYDKRSLTLPTSPIFSTPTLTKGRREILSNLLERTTSSWAAITIAAQCDCMDKLLNHCLGLLSSSASAIHRDSLREVITATAFDFSEKVRDPSIMDWALKIEDQANSEANSSMDQAASAYRWDENIDEWITRTPAIQKEKRVAMNPPPSPAIHKLPDVSKITRFSPIRMMIPLVPVQTLSSQFCGDLTPSELPRSTKTIVRKRRHSIDSTDLSSSSESESGEKEAEFVVPRAKRLRPMRRSRSSAHEPETAKMKSSPESLTSDNSPSADSDSEDSEEDELSKLERLEAKTLATLSSYNAGRARSRPQPQKKELQRKPVSIAEVKVVRPVSWASKGRGRRTVVESRNYGSWFGVNSSEDELGC